MNNRDRFLKTLRYESVDHPPVSIPEPWPITRKRWEQEGLPKGISLNEYFDIPETKLESVAFDTLIYPPFEEKIIEETDTFIIKINTNGVKERNFKNESSMPEWLEYPIKGRESLEWIKEKLNADNPRRLDPDWFEKAQKAKNNGSILFLNGGEYFGFLNEHIGTEKLLTMYFDDPKMIHEINELQCRCCEKGLETVLPKFKIDCIGYHEDMAYKVGSMISPAMVKEFMNPYYARIQKIATKYGIDLQFLDSDGNVWELIPIWLEFGINVIMPMEAAAGMDVVALRKKFGKQLRMIGGFDKRILASHNKQDIKKELERIKPVIEDGGYIPGLDHSAPPNISFENLCYYIDCIKNIYGMK